MKINCPKCRQPIPASQINVAADLAVCPACNEGFKVSARLDSDAVSSTPPIPPAGAWFDEGFNRVVIGATTRSYVAFLIVPFMCVWSGFSMWGIYGQQIIHNKFNLMTSLFGIPFVLGSVLFWSLAMMTICGKVEVRIEGDEATVFTGIGVIGWRKRFNWAGVEHIRENTQQVKYPGGQATCIVLEGADYVRFGSGISDERRNFILKALRYLRAKRR